MIEFLDAIADSFLGRGVVFAFVAGWLTLAASCVVYVATEDEYGDKGLFTGVVMIAGSVTFVLLWIVLRMVAWVVTGE